MNTSRSSRGRGSAQSAGKEWWILAALVVVIGTILIVWWINRKQYPEVTSPESLTLVRALYTACSSQNPSRVARVEALLDKCCRESKISPAEEEAFRTIIAQAKAQEWEEAKVASYRFAQDQVR